ncbi:MAG: isochorismatase family cysteine hydrolase [Anaerocolumna sp.]
MNKLLVVVDMQNDFIDGTLGTKEAVCIIDNVVNKIKDYKKNGNTIIFTMDTHKENYPETQEGKNLPVKHCIANTKGWEINKKIQDTVSLKNHKIYKKITFGSSELAKDLLNGIYDKMTHIELVGICTDICVISNAMLFKTLLPEVPVWVDAACCAGVTPDSHRNALEAMKMCQIKIIHER